MDSLIAPVLTIMDLVNLYHERLEQPGTYTSGTYMSGHIHSTKLKNRTLIWMLTNEVIMWSSYPMRILALH